ncbi:MAG: hypothetical protein LBB38_02825 [Puniceicoccales bacterium]|jgi:hypothetical protein|nr:hypothetical protein [Puniceicoccales bacterium]
MSPVAAAVGGQSRLGPFYKNFLACVITSALLAKLAACKALSEAAIARKIGGAVEFGYSIFGCVLRIALFVMTFGIMGIVFLVLRSEFHRKELWRAFENIDFSAKSGHRSAASSADDSTGSVAPFGLSPGTAYGPLFQCSPAVVAKASKNYGEACRILADLSDELDDVSNSEPITDHSAKLLLLGNTILQMAKASIAGDVAASAEADSFLAAASKWCDTKSSDVGDANLDAVPEAARKLAISEAKWRRDYCARIGSNSCHQDPLPISEQLRNAKLLIRRKRITNKLKSICNADADWCMIGRSYGGDDLANVAREMALRDALDRARSLLKSIIPLSFFNKSCQLTQVSSRAEAVLDGLEKIGSVNDFGSVVSALKKIDSILVPAYNSLFESYVLPATCCSVHTYETTLARNATYLAASLAHRRMTCALHLIEENRKRASATFARAYDVIPGIMTCFGVDIYNIFSESGRIADRLAKIEDVKQRGDATRVLCMLIVEEHCRIVTRGFYTAASENWCADAKDEIDDLVADSKIAAVLVKSMMQRDMDKISGEHLKRRTNELLVIFKKIHKRIGRYQIANPLAEDRCFALPF